MKAATRMRWALTGGLGKAILWLWAKSSRIRVEGWDEYARLRTAGKPVIILVWHRRIFLPPYFFRKRGVMPLISPSQDGEIIAQIVRRWGFKVSRGSSSHSIIRAWFEMKGELDRGGEVLIVPDGPRGPARVLKPGCIKLAQQTGAVLVPFAFSASKTKVFKSWDRFVIFHPFARVLVKLGAPITVDPALKGDALEAERARVEKILVDLDDAADAAFGARGLGGDGIS
jgi:lysophospholipid acyltransferase (LPLAT)-like uncharacterized protein